MLSVTGLKSSWRMSSQPSLLQWRVPTCFLLLPPPLEYRQQKMAKSSEVLGMDGVGKHAQGRDFSLSSTTCSGGLERHACLEQLLAGEMFLAISNIPLVHRLQTRCESYAEVAHGWLWKDLRPHPQRLSVFVGSKEARSSISTTSPFSFSSVWLCSRCLNLVLHFCCIAFIQNPQVQWHLIAHTATGMFFKAKNDSSHLACIWPRQGNLVLSW